MKNVKKKIAVCLVALGLGVVLTHKLRIDPPWLNMASNTESSEKNSISRRIDPPWLNMAMVGQRQNVNFERVCSIIDPPWLN